MPILQFGSYDILPVPNLQAYCAVSVLLVSFSLYHVFQVTSDSDWKLNQTASYGLEQQADSHLSERQIIEQQLVQALKSEVAQWTSPEEQAEMLMIINNMLSDPYVVRGLDMLFFMFREPLCFWTLINMAFCCLILLGKLMQRVVFGELRVSEQQNIKEKFWNFVFYKFIFLFGVLNVQYMGEIMLWCTWLSLLGFLNLVAQLCKDRFVYLTFSPTTPKWTHVRLIFLLITILGASVGLLFVCFLVGQLAGLSTFAIMAAECLLVAIRTLYILIRYAIHLWDCNHEGVWENRSIFIYYSDYLVEMITLTIDLLHYLHMLFCGPHFLSLASLVIIMQLRFFLTEIKRRFRKHKNYLQVVRLMELNFPMATVEEMEKYSDDCAICWEKMDTARRLPCGHLFHNFCLRSWLEQDTSCPTCRKSLKNRTETNGTNGDATDAVPQAPAIDPALMAAGNGPRLDGEMPRDDVPVVRNHFYHFDGRRYASWLPSVSVEVSRMNLSIGLIAGNAPLAPPNSQIEEDPLTAVELETMARQVLEWFPNTPFNLIVEDLRHTRSVNETVQNILDGHFPIVEEPIVPTQSPPATPIQPSASTPTTLANDQQPSTSSHTPTDVEADIRETQSIIISNDAQISESNEISGISTSELDQEMGTSTNEVSDTKSSVDCPSSKAYTSDFASNVRERESNLSQRKEHLYNVARKSLIARLSKTGETSSASSSSSKSD